VHFLSVSPFQVAMRLTIWLLVFFHAVPGGYKGN